MSLRTRVARASRFRDTYPGSSGSRQAVIVDGENLGLASTKTSMMGYIEREEDGDRPEQAKALDSRLVGTGETPSERSLAATGVSLTGVPV